MFTLPVADRIDTTAIMLPIFFHFLRESNRRIATRGEICPADHPHHRDNYYEHSECRHVVSTPSHREGSAVREK